MERKWHRFYIDLIGFSFNNVSINKINICNNNTKIVQSQRLGNVPNG